MLQIASGKLFSQPGGRENRLRGVLFTNVLIQRDAVVETVSGRLLPSSDYSQSPQVLTYEFVERMEGEVLRPGVLVSSGIEPYLSDFSTVMSFALNAVCTPDIDLARRLMSNQRGLATREVPQRLVRQFFDSEVWCKPDDLIFLEAFTKQLIGLPRRTFLSVMRAVRTYINGMHRIADDLDLGYTLLVASVESLAQEFDGHQSDWDSFPEKKRKAVDEALLGADEEVAQRVRTALLGVEHTALARRFREFAIAHTPSTYFRQMTEPMNPMSLGRSDLAKVLDAAYQTRSKYLHQLKQAPRAVRSLARDYSETGFDGRSKHLTLQGLSRLMRSVIIEFVMAQQIVEQEPYDYFFERFGVFRASMAPEYWIGHATGDIRKAGRDKLEGFLQQLASMHLKMPDAVLTDLRAVFSASYGFLPCLEKRLRRPYLALFFLFNVHVAQQDAAEMPQNIKTLIENELSEPSSEALIAHALTGQTVDWPLQEHRETVDAYFKRRYEKNGLRFPRLFEAAVTLELAERWRAAGDMAECRKVVAFAVENHPGHAGLLEAETNLQPDTSISWRKIMLPPHGNQLG